MPLSRFCETGKVRADGKGVIAYEITNTIL